MDDFLADLPKAELHLHLEGAVEPETLLELDPAAEERDPRALPLLRLRRLPQVVRRRSQAAPLSRRLRPGHPPPADTLARQNVRYAEITSPPAWCSGRSRSSRQSTKRSATPPRIRHRSAWIFDAVRQWGAEHAMKVARLAAERVNDGVVAFGIGGSEERGPAEWFTEVFAFARSAGLRLTAHAGESMGPESVWAALELGAERIGHGIAAARDPALLLHLRDRGIPLEICVTSNLVTGVVARIEDHPLRALYEAGVPIVLNSDDPAMFGCTLTGEFRLAAEKFGFTVAELRGIAENGFRYAFR